MEPAMDGLDELYMEIILDHYRDPRNRGGLAPPCLLYSYPSPRDATLSRMPYSA